MRNENGTLAKLLRQDVESICYEDGRKVGTPGHEMARQYLGRRLAEIGCVPFSGRSFDLPYQYKGQDFCNLIGRIPGRENRLAPMLVGAHYDSVIPHPCADDNAAAVAIALQTGRLIAEKGDLERDVVIAIFDAEEPPYYLSEGMGSNRFYEDHVVGKGEIHAAVIMDLVGHDISVPAKMLELVPGIGGFLKLIPGFSKKDISVPLLSSVTFVTGSESHENLPGVLEAIGQPPHLRVIPTLNNYLGDVSDHGIFRRNGVPYYFLSCGQWAHYHMPTDTPDRLNYDKMAAITNYVIQMMTSLDDCVLGGRTGLENIHETIELESAFMRDALGVLYRPAMKWAGLDEVNTRPKMDKFVRHLLSNGTAIL